MTGYESLTLLCVGLIVPIRIYSLVRYTWNLPLRNGPGFFLGVEVAPGFYDEPGSSWLRRYHTVLLAEHALEACILAVLLALSEWQAIPIWAGGSAVLFTGTMMTFVVWTRRALGANPPVRAVALALTSRRLGDYISWPLEALGAGMVACSWWLLLRQHAGPPIDWVNPLQMTWIALGLLPGKIALVRSGSPLPVERTEEHYQCQEAARRNGIRQMNAFGWFCVAILFGYGLKHGSPAGTLPGLPWIIGGIALAIMAYLMITVFRGERQMAEMGRDLRPSGSWATPFRRASFMSRPGLIWFIIWFGGILASIVYSLL